MIYVSLLLLLAVNFFVGRRLPMKRWLDFLLMHFLILCAQIILIFEITSLFGTLNQPASFLLLQGVFLIAAIAYCAATRKRPARDRFSLRQAFSRLGHFLLHNKVFTLYAALIFIAYLGIAWLSMTYPQTTSDSLYNHLSRIGHWLQQGSLQPYPSTSEYGFTYPYNNSLLMMGSVLFLKDDVLVGLTQWFSAFLLAASIFGLGLELKSSPKASAYAALIFLTFPIVLLEAGTAQNDLLAAAFFLAGTWLTINGLREGSRMRLVFAGLALGLAVGTKQYVLYALPGLLLIVLFLLFSKQIKQQTAVLRTWLIAAVVGTLLVGSYAYLQNLVNFGNFFLKEDTSILTPTRVGDLPAKFLYNGTRLTTQFFSCDGLPVPEQKTCLSAKGSLLNGFFSALHFDPRAKVFLLEQDCGELCYDYAARYPLNEESAWFGPLSWILLIAGAIVSLLRAGKSKDRLPWMLLLAAFLYFAVTAVFKSGWDPYLGRYLILSTALVTPFFAACLSEDRFWQKLITWVVLLASLVIATFTILSNDSRMLVTKDSMIELQGWGKDHHALLVTKLAYKITSQFPDTLSVTKMTLQDIEEHIDDQMSVQMGLVNAHVPADARLAILSPKELLLDYYLFGDHFTRPLYEYVPDGNNGDIAAKIDALKINYVLVKEDLSYDRLQSFKQVEEQKGWALYQRVSQP